MTAPLLIDMAGAKAALAMSRSSIYRLLSTGDLVAVKVHGKTRFRVSDLEAFTAGLPAFVPGQEGG